MVIPPLLPLPVAIASNLPHSTFTKPGVSMLILPLPTVYWLAPTTDTDDVSSFFPELSSATEPAFKYNL